MQLFTGAPAIIAGHSVGREGQSVHPGAAGASLVGRWLKPPGSSIRTLVARRTAAAIAASFTTPPAAIPALLEFTPEETIDGMEYLPKGRWRGIRIRHVIDLTDKAK